MPEKPEDIGKEILRNFSAMEEERKETCIHCGTVWYAMHYRDGVCRDCQAKGLPGRTVQKNRNVIRNVIEILGCVVLAIILFVLLVLSL
jgi:hypothetical protein